MRAIVHSKKPTATGVIQRGNEIVELSGDLNGKVLYHVTGTGKTADGNPTFSYTGTCKFGRRIVQ